jgi:hypothetical protein
VFVDISIGCFPSLSSHGNGHMSMSMSMSRWHLSSLMPSIKIMLWQHFWNLCPNLWHHWWYLLLWCHWYSEPDLHMTSLIVACAWFTYMMSWFAWWHWWLPMPDLYMMSWFAQCHWWYLCLNYIWPMIYMMSLMVPVSDLHMMLWLAWYHNLPTSFR